MNINKGLFAVYCVVGNFRSILRFMKILTGSAIPLLTSIKLLMDSLLGLYSLKIETIFLIFQKCRASGSNSKSARCYKVIQNTAIPLQD